MKKTIALILVFAIISVASGAFAAQDIPTNAAYSGAVARVTSLGIMDTSSSGTFNPNNITTRAQFAKSMVIAASLSDQADSLKGPTAFSDIPSDGADNGYINEALNKGYITGKADGKFHPGDSITFAEVCTAMVKILGYTDADVPGTWPQNYIGKAKALGLTAGVDLSSSAQVQRWAMAVMMDNLLDTDLKKVNPTDAAKTLAQASSLTTDSMYTVYSKPEVAKNFVPIKLKLGAIDFHGYPDIVRNTVDNSTVPATVRTGEAITIYQIKDYDVAYQVSDKSGNNRYILVINNKVTGKISGILPNKFAPTSVQIGGQSYQLGQYFDMKKLNSSSGSFRIDDDVTLLLGYDGKVVDILSAVGEDNSNYAFVTGFTSTVSTDPANTGKRLYTVNLLLTDGTNETYSIDTDPSGLKGDLVTYSMKDAKTVVLTQLAYSIPVTTTTTDPITGLTTTTTTGVTYGEMTIKKDDGQIVDSSGNMSYAAGNIKIFNLVTNDGSSTNVQLLNWSELPSGLLQAGKVLYMNTAGDFGDVNVLLLNDIFDEYYQFGMVESQGQTNNRGKITYSYNIIVGSQQYTYNTSSPDLNLSRGVVVKVKVVNGSFNSIVEYLNPAVQNSVVQAVDLNRIKVNNVIYQFKDNRNIYLLDNTGSVSAIGTDDIEKDKIYASVAVYLDKPLAYGGKVQTLVLKEI